jgi:hypothetical protein
MKYLPSYLHAMILRIVYSKFWGFGFKTRGLQGHMSSATYFLNLVEDKNNRLKTKLALSLILRVNLRLGSYSIWSASSIAPHIKEDLTGSIQTRKYLEGTFKMEFGRTRRRLQKYSEACSTRLCRARGLVRAEPTGLRTWSTSYRISGERWSTLYTGCNYS